MFLNAPHCGVEEKGKMEMLLDKEILAVKSPLERAQGHCIRGPWIVLHKTQTDNGVEAYVLLEWQDEPDDPFVRCIGKRLFTEDELGKPVRYGYPYWAITSPDVINGLPLNEKIKTIAEDYLGGKDDSLSTACLRTISNLKQTLEFAGFDTERNLNICCCLYQKMNKRTHEQNEKEARAIDGELDRIMAESNGKPATQTLEDFIKKLDLDM
jgi:hypothetical protein